MNGTKYFGAAICSLALTTIAISPAHAGKKEPVELVKCEQSYGSIAVVDGSTKGWSEFGLGSPRELVATLALESGCFTIHSPASSEPASFLVNVIAGDKEEVDQGMEAAKGAATEAFFRSGAAGQVLGKVPGAGALIGMFGGLGGKKKTVAAGITIVSPANGQTLITGTGQVKKSTLSFRGGGTPWIAGANAAGYGDSKNGQMLTEAFIIAFNNVVGQAGALSVAPAAAETQDDPVYTVAVDTSMYASADANADAVRTLRADTELKPTGNKMGLFVEVTDNYGTKGWVSVEDLR